MERNEIDCKIKAKNEDTNRYKTNLYHATL